MKKRNRVLARGLLSMAGFALLASAAISCGDPAAWTGAPSPTGDETESASHALATSEPSTTSGASGLGLDFTPPGGLYMTSFSATFQNLGEYAHTAYFYQPNAALVAVRFTLRSEISGTSTRDPATVFGNMSLVRNPDQPNPTEEGLTAVVDGVHFDGVTRGQGWYALKFVYRPTGSNRVMTYEAVDAQGSPMKTAWVAPSGKNCKVTANFKVTSAQNVYFKGAAFSGATIQQFAYADNIKVNGKLMYRKSFDQGFFNHPIGFLPGMTHSLEFDFAAWPGAPSRSWFGVSAVSFDPNQVKTRWDAVQFLYQGPMHTGDYDAWNEGVAFAQSTGSVGTGNASFPRLGVRPPPVRRGTTFGIAVENSSLVGTSSNAIVEIAQADTGTLVTWPRSITSGFDYLGGVYSSVGWSPTGREHWNVTIPMDAAIGRYVLKAYTPSRTQIGSDVLFYVIHNPYAYVGTAGLTKAEVEAYGYDEDEDGLGWNLASTQADADQDHGRDNYVVVVSIPNYDDQGGYTPPETYSGTVVNTGAFRRSSDRATWDHSMLDYAMASVQGTTTEFESMVRLLRFVNQRATYENSRMSEDAEGGLGGWAEEDPARTLAIANACSQPGTVPPECVHGRAVCYTFASRLAAIARSAGLISRALNSDTHAVTETYLPNPPNGTSFPNGDRWFVFDSTDHKSNPEGGFADPYDPSDQPSAFFGNYWESVGQRGQHCLGQKFTLAIESASVGNPRCNWITTSLDWVVPEGPGSFDLGSNGGKILTADYETDAGYWIPASGMTGWLAFGDKVVYRINKASVNANYIRVRALPSKAGTNLVPEMCILAPPLELSASKLKQRCADAANVRKIPDGDSYVVVFNDSNNLQRFHGDVTQFRIEVGSGSGWERCDDGIKNGQELAVDCGGNCPGCRIGQACTMAPDCQSLVCNYRTNKCVAACNVSTAVDMGVPGQQTIVPSDGCVKVQSGYPSWWGTRTMNLLNGGGARYPIPFLYSQHCPDNDFTSSGEITTDWETHLVGPITAPCPTVFDLRGDGTSNVILYYYGL